MMKEEMLRLFEQVFGNRNGVNVYFTPGGVNLLGEHTDYNGGHIVPCSLNIGTYAAARKRTDSRVRFYSQNFDSLGMIESDINHLVYKEEDNWSNYPKGVFWELKNRGYEIPCGMDIVYYGTIPNTSDLSSSASMEVLTVFVCKDLYQLDIDEVQTALIAQCAENEFNGIQDKIMDPFAVAMGKKNYAIFLDTKTLDYEYAPINLDGYKIVIMNSNKRRGLGDSKYNERKEECARALSKLKKVLPIENLGDLTEELFEKYQNHIGDRILLKRARHAVSENRRTIKAIEALKNNDLQLFGQLINQSGDSLKEDYEMTGKELDVLVAAARKQKEVLGARMTGRGFGGCAISIVREDCVPEFIEKVGKEYREKIGYRADFYVLDIGNGPEILK